MNVRVGVAVMAALVALYAVLVGWRAVGFILTGEPVGIALGAALIVFPVLAVWAIWREILFGARATRLTRMLETDGALPEQSLPARPSGRVDRAAADAVFPGFRRAVQEHPDDWRAWLRLGLSYDAAGDRRRARAAVRHAIALERGA